MVNNGTTYPFLHQNTHAVISQMLPSHPSVVKECKTERLSPSGLSQGRQDLESCLFEMRVLLTFPTQHFRLGPGD